MYKNKAMYLFFKSRRMNPENIQPPPMFDDKQLSPFYRMIGEPAA
jgi:hypothetical protein